MAGPPPGKVPVKVSADIMRLGISNLQQKSRGASLPQEGSNVDRLFGMLLSDVRRWALWSFAVGRPGCQAGSRGC